MLWEQSRAEYLGMKLVVQLEHCLVAKLVFGKVEWLAECLEYNWAALLGAKLVGRLVLWLVEHLAVWKEEKWADPKEHW